ncbi:hypothetical protein C2S53_002791 [Perilla frutescens var. hirtella]|uniref:Probable glutathione S-transferase n=1 Tax=Perilla frutescens var. hirtella TaxID=608512 RepID=A0AAD4NYN6_PERFH|nr:hypothetical protein C2S53_002791 [Perilla frutescens var. hirtella]
MEKNNKSVKVVGYWVSAYVHRVRWALKLKGIEYEYIEEDLFNRSSLLSQLNPVHGKVPVLVHDGNPLPESAIILEYIDEVWTQHPLLPLDAHERAQLRFWAKIIDQKIITSTILAVYSEGEDQERAVKLAVEYLDKIEEKIRGKSFFGGEELGYMDLMMGFAAYLLPVWEEVASVKFIDPSRFPAITAWTDNFLDHPVIKAEYLPPKDELFNFYVGRQKEAIHLLASHSDLGKKMWADLLS